MRLPVLSLLLGLWLSITALPAPGYAFAGWSDPTLPDTATVTLDPAGERPLTAIFAPAP